MLHNNVRIMYLRRKPQYDELRGKPIACIAIRINDTKIEYRTATHHPNDNFDRHLAQTIAKDRLTASPNVIDDASIEGMNEVSRAVMEKIAHDHNEPTRSRNAARFWLKENVAD